MTAKSKPSTTGMARIFFQRMLALAVGFATVGDVIAEPSSPVVASSGKPGTGSRYARSEASYVLPDVILVRQDGEKVSFGKAIDDGRPVFLNFVFASCTTICPMLSHLLTQTQKKLGVDAERVHLVSISIDPENDTPAKLQEYAKKLKAGPGWDHYTGSAEASIAVQNAFKAYRGNKMNHLPLTFVRSAPGKPWLRLDGLITADELIAEFHGLTQQQNVTTGQ